MDNSEVALPLKKDTNPYLCCSQHSRRGDHPDHRPDDGPEDLGQRHVRHRREHERTADTAGS